ncbi:uncharacterized protein LOC117166053 [Bombus vancouverensis nearcticus]|uniref:uncharacterized protein LOC117166053 n=1 Tax=Bombus vancouverensis nearcticus TaxID=2705178 RepID=UPI00402B6183
MDTSKDTLICRLCGVNLVKGKHKSIFEGSTDLIHKIKETLPISISIDDNGSKYVCLSCYDKITFYYKFIQEVLEYSKRLENVSQIESFFDRSKEVTDFSQIHSDAIYTCPNCNVDLMILLVSNSQGCDYTFQISLAMVNHSENKHIKKKNIQIHKNVVHLNNTKNNIHLKHGNKTTITEDIENMPNQEVSLTLPVLISTNYYKEENLNCIDALSSKQNTKIEVEQDTKEDLKESNSVHLSKISKVQEISHVSNNLMDYVYNSADPLVKNEPESDNTYWLDSETDYKSEKDTCITSQDTMLEQNDIQDENDIYKSCLKYVCKLCGARYLSHLKYEFHMERHKLGKTDRYECTLCDKETSNENLLWDHYFHTHKSLQRYICVECGKLFTKRTRLNGHQKNYKHSGVKQIQVGTSEDDISEDVIQKAIATTKQEKVSINCNLCGKLISDLDPDAINDLVTCATCEDSTLSLMIDGNETKVISPRDIFVIYPTVEGESIVKMAGEKRTQDQEETLLSETVILIDIEGTTTSISFVKDTLFPYVRENLKKYIETKWEDEEFKQDFEKLKEQAKKDEEDKIDGFVPITGTNAEEERKSLAKNILWQMDGDRKTGALKQLQGHMWHEAYNSGTIKAHVYEDVPKALESWTSDGKKVYIYSSGSVEAQKLLFGHSIHGDLLKYFSGYFDTEVGAKQESSSYKNILNKIGAEPSSVIFLTDVVKEAAAAKEAGLSTVIVLREGNAPLTDEERVAFTTIKSFLDLTFQTSTKRQKLETTEVQESKSKSTSDVSEPMDTSEDVEMTDKVETKEVVQEEAKECIKDQQQKEAPVTDVKMEEPMVIDTKDAPNAEKLENTAEKVELQPSEVSTKLDTSENVQADVSSNAESVAIPSKDDEKSAISEKVEKPIDTEKSVESIPEATPTANDPLDVGMSEPKSKSEEVSITENKTEESSNTAKETKSDDMKVSEVKPAETASKEKDSNSINEKSEECANKPEKETKEESTEKVVITPSITETKASENESSVKPAQEPTKTEEKPAENGNVPLTSVEKITAPTITEPEATSSKADTNTEIKNTTEVAKETKSETETELTNVKSPKTKETEETATSANDAEKQVSAEASKQELTEKPTKEEAVADETKETNTVDSEKKKLNGTTQNGDTDVPLSDDKLQRNGLNEGSSNENVNSSTSGSTSAQNGEPESSSETSAESIKVKKVVDSAVADGAGEPDVVPPVVVAATS